MNTLRMRSTLFLAAFAVHIGIAQGEESDVKIDMFLGKWKIDCSITGPSGQNHELSIQRNKYSYRQGSEGNWEDVIGETRLIGAGILVVYSGYSPQPKGVIFELKKGRLVDEARGISLERCSRE